MKRSMIVFQIRFFIATGLMWILLGTWLFSPVHGEELYNNTGTVIYTGFTEGQEILVNNQGIYTISGLATQRFSLSGTLLASIVPGDFYGGRMIELNGILYLCILGDVYKLPSLFDNDSSIIEVGNDLWGGGDAITSVPPNMLVSSCDLIWKYSPDGYRIGGLSYVPTIPACISDIYWDGTSMYYGDPLLHAVTGSYLYRWDDKWNPCFATSSRSFTQDDKGNLILVNSTESKIDIYNSGYQLVQTIDMSGAYSQPRSASFYNGTLYVITSNKIVTFGRNPVVTSSSPNYGYKGDTITISLTGTEFKTGSSVNAIRLNDTQNQIPATGFSVASDTSITGVRFNLTGATPGMYFIEVSNNGGTTWHRSSSKLFTVYSVPVVTGSTPATGYGGNTVTVALTGTNFNSGSSVNAIRLNDGSYQIPATGFTVASGTSITGVQFSLISVTGGSYYIEVSNNGGTTWHRSGTRIFTILGCPSVISLKPGSASNTGPVRITNLSGTNFESGMMVNLTRTGYPNITATEVTVHHPGLITCILPITGAAAGTWNVTVYNPTRLFGTLKNGFVIFRSTTTVTSVTPSSAPNTASISMVNITGSNFHTGSVVNLTRTGYANITATNVMVYPDTRISCTLPITGAAPGMWNLAVRNKDGLAGTLANAFIVTSSAHAASQVGVWRSPHWFLDWSGNGAYGSGDVTYMLGATGDIPVTGDWNGNGRCEIGVWRPATHLWFLDWSGDGAYETGDVTYSLGATGDIPVTGDWNGNGRCEIGVWRPTTRQWFLDWSGNGAYGTGDVTYTLGAAGDIPVTGDWTGNGRTEIGVWRPTIHQWFLDWSGDGAYGTGDNTYTFGATGDKPVIGDWNGDGRCEIGVWRPTIHQWFLDWSGDGAYGTGDVTYTYGATGDIPVTGAWSGSSGSVSIELVNLTETVKPVPAVPLPGVSMPVNAIPRVSMPVKSSNVVTPATIGGHPADKNPLAAGGGVQIPGTV